MTITTRHVNIYAKMAILISAFAVGIALTF